MRGGLALAIATLGALAAGCGGSRCGGAGAIRVVFTRPFALGYSGSVMVTGRSLSLVGCPGVSTADGWTVSCQSDGVLVIGSGLDVDGADQAVLTLATAWGLVLANELTVPLGPPFGATGVCERDGVATLNIPSVVDTAALTLEPSMADFGPAALGATAGPIAFTLANRGLATTGVPQVIVTGGDFALGRVDCLDGIPPDGSCAVQVIFRPTAPGRRTGTLTLAATVGGTASAALTGEGLGSPADGGTP